MKIIELIREKKFEAAKKEIERRYANNPSKYWYYMGLLLLAQLDYGYAYAAFMRAKLYIGEDDDMARAMAFACFGLGKYREAIKHLESIREKTVEDLMFLTFTYLIIKDITTARAYLSAAYERDKGRTKEMLVLIYTSFLKGRISEKIKKKFIELLNLL